MRWLRLLRELQFLLEFLLIWPLVALVRALPEPAARALAIGLARVAYRALWRDRGWALRNLELVFGPNLRPAQRTRLAIRSFEHILLTRVEGLRWSLDRMLAGVIEENGEAARAAQREAAARGVGVIVVSAHLGNFELIPSWIYKDGFRGPVVYRPQDNWRVERLLAGARAEYLLGQALPRGGFTTLSLMYALREGRGVGLLIDINTLDAPVFADFLGFPAASPAGAAALALATGAPVLLAVAVRRPDGRHRLIFHEPFPLIRTGDRRADIAANTQQYHAALEPYILAHPEQYNWPHPRWRRRPDGSFWTLDQPVGRQAAERIGPPRQVTPTAPTPR
jgi:KDO2-lipid IV(A) lauroyltransferase